MEYTSSVALISQLPNNKQNIATFVADFKDRFLNGAIDPLETLAQLKMVEKTIAELLSDPEIEAAIMADAEHYHKDELANLHGCKFEVREVGVKYDYSVTDDTVLFEMQKEAEKLDKQIKERQKMLQSLSGEMYNAEGVQLRRPIKGGKSKVVVTIK